MKPAYVSKESGVRADHARLHDQLLSRAAEKDIIAWGGLVF